ncbi:TPA: helix-turn-helix transcriptional regulator [Streptococcus suis]|uniref:helix-turn-helix transcriptional regulator n=1 Tax=Streptococcus suis TaxID=1307 RepID=UPI002003F6BA|nr:helix-turn-helix transcriptional regulator [Streptococcus suis]MCK4070979.1 helix-turn-helix transcriptional regulator [Streptococcus suis]WNF71701.1 helix-turn-helix transcriptional regulator [Streptococcus suis]HEL9598079.1 helix-turn-helix transcriptional regulator [Streptococcus suis]HEO8622756.1 helix-turn-helix transcriptional regulator [Streptococcus suis]
MQSKLYALRRERNITQEQMAKHLGISTSTYRNKEMDRQEFKSSEMFAISKIFEMEISKIFLDKEFT